MCGSCESDDGYCRLLRGGMPQMRGYTIPRFRFIGAGFAHASRLGRILARICEIQNIQNIRTLYFYFNMSLGISGGTVSLLRSRPTGTAAASTGVPGRPLLTIKSRMLAAVNAGDARALGALLLARDSDAAIDVKVMHAALSRAASLGHTGCVRVRCCMRQRPGCCW